jgi:hypothetical protein
MTDTAYGMMAYFNDALYIYKGDGAHTEIWSNVASPTYTATATPTATATVTILDYTASVWSGRVYEALGNTYLAMRNYYGAVSGSAGYGNVTANEQQNIFYRAGLMLIKKFKTLTSYSTNIKTISRISNVSIKATAEANFVATMTPVYTLLPEADIHLSRGLNVTKATKDTIKINQGRSYINYVATYVVSH